jgi:hypothetical protein
MEIKRTLKGKIYPRIVESGGKKQKRHETSNLRNPDPDSLAGSGILLISSTFGSNSVKRYGRLYLSLKKNSRLTNSCENPIFIYM